MANYSLILDTKFKPFSYAEMLAPVAAATQAHQAIEEEYGNLTTKANVWEEMANEQTDPYAYKMYKTYSDDLEARAEQLMRYGLNASSRKGMLDMRARYSKEIVPIENAYKRREELAAEQRKALAQNPTMLYQRMASTMSLDDFIKNPSLDYGQQYSGALITQQVSSAAANLAKEARDSEEGRRKLRKILPYQYELVQQNGFSREAVMKAILNSPDADKILTGLVEDAITSSGVKEWGDKTTQRRAYDYARQGLYSAIGQTSYQMVTDQAGLTRLQYDLQDRNNRRAENRRAAAARQAQRVATGNLPINIDRLASPNQLGAKAGSNAVKALKTLGLTPGSTRITNPTQLAIIESGHAVAITKKDGSGFTLWKKADNGKMRLMTRSEFIQANSGNLTGDEELNRKRMGNWYDTEISKGAYRNLGYTGNRVVYQQDALSRASNITTGGGAITMSAVRINFGTDSKNVLSSLVEISRNGNDTGIREVTSFDDKGTLTYGKHLKVGDLLDDKGNLKGNGTPVFYAHPQATTDGILMKYNGKMYAVPKRFLGSLGNESYKVDIPVLEEAISTKQSLIKQYGEDAYYNSSEGQLLEETINNAGAGYTRAVANSLGMTYNQPNYNVYESSENEM